jgi:hypothetical protein
MLQFHPRTHQPNFSSTISEHGRLDSGRTPYLVQNPHSAVVPSHINFTEQTEIMARPPPIFRLHWLKRHVQFDVILIFREKKSVCFRAASSLARPRPCFVESGRGVLAAGRAGAEHRGD